MSSGLGNQREGLVLVETNDDVKDNNVKLTTNAEQIHEEDLEVFQPTSEWQAIRPGQGIPAGLHVRMNLQTGEKEAKLMDGDDGSKYKIDKDSKQKFINIDKNVISKQHLKEALKEFRDKFHDESPDGENSEQTQSQLDPSEYIVHLHYCHIQIKIETTCRYKCSKYTFLAHFFLVSSDTLV